MIPRAVLSSAAELHAAAASLYGQNQFADALSLLDAHASIVHVDAALLNLAAACHLALGDAPHAARAWQQAIAVDPNCIDAHNNLGILFGREGRTGDAIDCYRHVLARAPRHVEAHVNLGNALAALGRYDEAEASYRCALGVDPHHADARLNYGVLLHAQERLPEAGTMLRAALASRPDHALTQFNLGVVAKKQRAFAQAEAAYRAALEGNPGHVDTQLNLAHLLLGMGRYEEGFARFEVRHEALRRAHAGTSTPRIAHAPFPFPMWRGESLNGKSLLVWPEQGFGDSLQFCRYLPMLRARGVAQLTLACHPALIPLFETLDGVDACIPSIDPPAIAAHDYQCLLMSLPHRFGTTLDSVPAATPYLRVPPARREAWADALPAGRFRVGIVWAGDPRRDEPALRAVDRARSLDPRALMPLLRVPGVTFISLQKGDTTQPLIDALPPDLRPFDPMAAVRDFADTAAIVEQLDLVVSVDTSVVHLAGALGCPTWILSRYDGCWRWLHDGETSPWYPRARLFRQRQPNQWDEVVERVVDALKQAVTRIADAA